jgi:TonB-dependent receptor
MRIISTKQLLILSMLFMLSGSILGQSTLHGIVADSSTHESLIGANIVLVGTSQGAATNLDGEYKIPNIAEGTYQIRVSYVGYETKIINLTFKGDGPLELNIQLSTRRIEGKTITITAQSQGQLAAINEQLSSNKIVNVVSADKMKELPDANIAESIGRLPGISLQRNAGEATAVVVRGLSPKYNQVSIEGIPMSSTNYYDRGIDLSLLSDDLIKGVEVSKTLRPDMDADALGGTVNLTLKTAQTGLHYDIKGTGAYNNLRSDYNNYKFTGSVSNRFFDNAIGVQLQGNIEEKQLPSDQLTADYQSPTFDPKTNLFNITDKDAILQESNIKRHRFGVSLILDYSSDFVDLKLFNVYDQKTDSTKTRLYQTTFGTNTFYDQINVNETKTIQETHSLQALFKFWGTELPISVSYTKGQQSTPHGLQFDFQETGAFTTIANSNLIYAEPSSLISLSGVFNPAAANSVFNGGYVNNSRLNDDSYDAKLDWKIPFKFSDYLSGVISAGGKYHTIERENSNNSYFLYMTYGQGIGNEINLTSGMIPFLKGTKYDETKGIYALPFVDPAYSRTSILGYPIDGMGGVTRNGWNINNLVSMMNYYYANYQANYYLNGPNSYNQDYNDKETSLAGYIMGEFNLGSDLTIVPGARYQEEKTDISAYHIWENDLKIPGVDKTPVLTDTKRDNPDWFPSVNIKYKATDNIQVLGAAYRSVSLPSYIDISPELILNDGGSGTLGQEGNPLLLPSTATNFDLGVSLFSNVIGLFTVNGFYKEISNLISSIQNFYPYSPYPIIGAPSDLSQRLPGKNYFDSSWNNSKQRALVNGSIPMNDPSKAYLRGIELSWQTHLWYLPGVLSGIVLDLNLSLMNSKQEYPNFALKTKTKLTAPDTLLYETVTGALQNQPNATYNAIIGWDYMGFSTRVSVRYQGKTLTSMDTKYGLQDSYYDNIWSTDISVKQQIMEGLSIYANATNVNNHIDNYYYSHPAYTATTSSSTNIYPAGLLPTSGQTYGWAIQVGVSFVY